MLAQVYRSIRANPLKPRRLQVHYGVGGEMPVDPKFLLDPMCPAAAAAYFIMTNPNPQMPAGFTLAGPIVADPQQAALAIAAAGAAQLQLVHAMMLDSPIFGFVAWNNAASTALVSFRGTQTVKDWLDNLDTTVVPYTPVNGNGLVHMGFQLVYEHIRQKVSQLLVQKCQGAKRILVTGHSLGGALAVLSALDIAKNVPPGVVPELYTFAGPRAGAPDFADRFNALIPICCRVVNFMDVVPQVPLPPLFEHVGQELKVDGGFKPLDPVFAHHITTYQAGLQKLVH
jgi:triacylglycerol lipase